MRALEPGNRDYSRRVASTGDHQHPWEVPMACTKNSPAQPNPVGSLALTKKFRSGIFTLISTLRGERVDARALPDGVRPL